MNILIVGNGFDLSHYLPTKYDHFMDVMAAIEKKDLGKPIQNVLNNPVNTLPDLILKVLDIKLATDEKTYKMNFNSLFLECRDKKFIDKTKEIYDISSVELSIEKIVKFQYELKNNCWYQYFKDHVKEVKTWIDFELKIEEVLNAFASCILEIEKIKRSSELFEYFDHKKDDGHRIKERDFKILNFFNFIAAEEYKARLPSISLHTETKYKVMSRDNINPKFCHGGQLLNGFNSSGFLGFLYQQLDDFIVIFEQYLSLIIAKLNPNNRLMINFREYNYPDKIFSFNYTNTYQRLYHAIEVDYLHGRCGDYQNIVLGIAELEDEALKKIKAYGFTKYHQKLFKETNYSFLDEYLKRVESHKKKVEYFEKDSDNRDSTAKKFERQRLIETESKLNLNISIWGHSLDISDKDYIIDLFSLNDDIDRNVRVTVYYFDKLAKFSLLNNLLAILGKDKVEQWMKNKWLEFNENPEIKFIEAENQQIA